MKRRTGILGEYVQVRRKGNGSLTYGGDQGFFDLQRATKRDKRKKESGCGLVAFTDMLLYLGSRNRRFCIPETENYVKGILTEEEYKSCYNAVYDFYGGIPFKGGVSGFGLSFRFNRLSRREGFSLSAIWGLSGRKIFDRIEEMLSEDIPVILCIPMMLFRKDKKDGLWLYEREEKQDGTCLYHRKAFTGAHYITITGVIEEKDGVYYEISSWGKKYYMNRNEYDILIHTHFMGTILGNILYIRRRKQKGT